MMIELNNISYSYEANGPETNVALDNINLKIDKGEFIGIAGHTGSGKTTIAQILSGLIIPTCGKIIIDGEEIADYKQAAKELRKRVGIVFQYPEHQLFEETVYKDIAFGAKNRGVSEDEVDECVRKCAELANIKEELLKKSPFELSGGQKRRVAIAGMLATNPSVLILDEPAAGLDPSGRKKLLSLLRKIREEENKTIVLISHSMEDLSENAERIVVLSGGKIIEDNEAKSVFTNGNLLNKSGLEMPEITRIFNILRQGGMEVKEDVFTLDDAVCEILKKAGVEQC